MSQKELDRAKVLDRLIRGYCTPTLAAQEIGLSRSQLYRLLARYRTHGVTALQSPKRGVASNRAMPTAFKEHVTGIVRSEYPDFGPTFAAEKLAEHHDCLINPETLRLWMIEASLWKTRRQRANRVHQPRHRRECFGELIQIDGSDHWWFEERGDRCTLLVFIDDATSTLVHLKFVESESALAYFQSTREYILAYGKPIAFYSDKHSVFRVSPSKTSSQEGLTQYGRALADINIDIICANTSQAKGRVERVNKTLQDRLVKELRLRDISTLEAGNAYLEEYRFAHNARFAKPARNAKDLHRRAVDSEQLDKAFSWQTQRKVTQSLTVQYNKMMFILDPKAEGVRETAGHRVTIHDYPDGRLEIRFDGRALPYRIFDKKQIVTPAAIVENKRLDAVLTQIRAKQEKQIRPGSDKTGPRRRTQTHGPFKAREATSEAVTLHTAPVLSDGRDRSACQIAYRTVSAALTVQHRYVRYTLIDQHDPQSIIGRELTLCEHTDGEVELLLDGNIVPCRTLKLKDAPSDNNGKGFVRRHTRAS